MPCSRADGDSHGRSRDVSEVSGAAAVTVKTNIRQVGQAARSDVTRPVTLTLTVIQCQCRAAYLLRCVDVSTVVNESLHNSAPSPVSGDVKGGVSVLRGKDMQDVKRM